MPETGPSPSTVIRWVTRGRRSTNLPFRRVSRRGAGTARALQRSRSSRPRLDIDPYRNNPFLPLAWLEPDRAAEEAEHSEILARWGNRPMPRGSAFPADLTLPQGCTPGTDAYYAWLFEGGSCGDR